MKKIFYIFLGSLTFIVGTIGIFLPFLPTTVFYLLTAFFWLRSSETLYQRFVQSERYQKYVQNGLINRQMSTKGMLKMFLMMFIMFLIPCLLVNITLIRTSLAIVYLLHVIGLTYHLKIRGAKKNSTTKLGKADD